MKKLFFVIGAPGSGKTTDASIIANKNDNITHYSTGDLLREEVARASDLGILIDSFISKGDLVPLNIVIDTIISAIKRSPTAIIIIDGYPRSIEQMIEFDKVLKNNKDISLKAVIEIRVSLDTAKERVLGRARGDDDNEIVFNNRMKVYNKPLKDIIKFYDDINLHFIIDGERSIETIVDDMQKLINTKI